MRGSFKRICFCFVAFPNLSSVDWGATVWLRNPTARAPSRTDSGAKHYYCASDNHSNVRAASSTDFFLVFGLHFQIQRPRCPRAQIWGCQKKHFWGHAPRSNVQAALKRGFGGAKSKVLGSRLQIQRPERPRALI